MAKRFILHVLVDEDELRFYESIIDQPLKDLIVQEMGILEEQGINLVAVEEI